MIRRGNPKNKEVRKMEGIVIKKLKNVPSRIDLRYVCYKDAKRAIWNDCSLNKEEVRALKSLFDEMWELMDNPDRNKED